jgi:hypothetical protein
MSRPIRDNILSFEHDTDAFEHPKFLALRARFGWAGEGQFWALNSLIARATGARLDITRAFAKAGVTQKLGMEEAQFDVFVSFLADPQACGLIHNEGGILWTDRTQDELKAANRARTAERIRKGGTVEQLSGTEPPENHSNPAGASTETTIGGTEKGVFRCPVPSRPVPSSTSPTVVTVAPPSKGGGPLQPGEEAKPFSSLLKTTLASAGISIPQQDLDAVAVKCIATSCDSAAFLTWAIQQAAKAKQRGTWIVKGVLSWNWCAKFKAQAAAPAPAAAKPAPYVAPELHQPSPADDAAVELEAARTRKRMHMPLSDRDRELLREPARSAEQPVDNRSPPGVDKGADNAPEEFPEPAVVAEADIF